VNVAAAVDGVMAAEAADDFFSGAGPAGFVLKRVPLTSRTSGSCGIFWPSVGALFRAGFRATAWVINASWRRPWSGPGILPLLASLKNA